MSSPAAWHNDPYGRFAKRYWDGANWTEHVVTGDGKQQVDPMGTSTSIPFSTPESASGGAAAGATQSFAAMSGDSAGGGGGGWQPPATAGDGAASPSSTSGGGFFGFLDRMAPDSKQRPTPRLDAAIAGLGGVFAALAILLFIAGEDASRSQGILAFAVVLGLALAVRLFVRSQLEARSAAVGAGAIGIVGLSLAITVSSDSDAASMTPWLVLGAVALAAWALPGFLGRPLMLGVGLQALVIAIGVGTADTSNEFADATTLATNSASTASTIFLLLGALMMGGTWFLDRRGYHGTATPVVAVGLLTTLIGGAGLAAKFGDTGGPLLLTLVGVLICVVGGHGRRRATTWVGALFTAIGVAVVLFNMMEPKSAGAGGGAMLLTAAVLIGGAILLSKIRVTRPADETAAENAAN